MPNEEASDESNFIGQKSHRGRWGRSTGSPRPCLTKAGIPSPQRFDPEGSSGQLHRTRRQPSQFRNRFGRFKTCFTVAHQEATEIKTIAKPKLETRERERKWFTLSLLPHLSLSLSYLANFSLYFTVPLFVSLSDSLSLALSALASIFFTFKYPFSRPHTR